MESDRISHSRFVGAYSAAGRCRVRAIHGFPLASIFFRAVVASALLATVSGCNPVDDTSAESDRRLMGAPVAGDIYAAELTYFSEASFENEAKVYGLIKVLAVDEAKVTVVTENAGSAIDSVSREEIRGEMRDIEFDDSEQIEIDHTELVKAHQAGKIFAVRRPSPSARSSE